jgi:hypothetical protein
VDILARSGHLTLPLKKPCRGFYVSQNILPTSFEIDQIQNFIDIGNSFIYFQEAALWIHLGHSVALGLCEVF